MTDQGRALRTLEAAKTAIDAAVAADRLNEYVAELLDTNARLNRRCQLAEAAANLKVEEWDKRSTGQGRAYIFQMGKDAGQTALSDALGQYGRHLDGCTTFDQQPPSCTCGFFASLSGRTK